jgi:hypothetical protein
MSRTKKKSSPPPTQTSKKRKSASPIPTSNSHQQELWCRHRDCLSPEVRETVERETNLARAAGGSRLSVALHLLIVRRILCGDATNSKQKKLWSAYLAANLPGFSISRAQVFKDISAAAAAQEVFPTTFLNAFVNSGYALNVRPTVVQPLGKFTEPSKHRLSKLPSDELGEQECLELLALAAEAIKAEAKRNRNDKPTVTLQVKRDGIYADIHNSVIRGMEKLSRAIEPGYSYTATDFRDDLETIVGRLMTAAGFDALDAETKNLPEGFNRLNVPGSAVESSDTDDTNEAALAATAA